MKLIGGHAGVLKLPGTARMHDPASDHEPIGVAGVGIGIWKLVPRDIEADHDAIQVVELQFSSRNLRVPVSIVMVSSPRNVPSLTSIQV